MTYNIAFIGYGSIAKRHLSNLVTVSRENKFEISVDIFRLNVKKNDLIHEVDNVFALDTVDKIEKSYDFVFITSPTHTHYKYLMIFKNYSQRIFIEKPVFHKSNLLAYNYKFLENKYIYVACPLRYLEGFRYLKKYLKNKSVFSARAISSSYLPDWRNQSDYRKNYSAFAEYGGGVDLDLIHEWDYLISLFGFPTEIKSYKEKYSNLEINSNDIAIYIAKYHNMAIEIHLDYFGRVPIRKLEIFTDTDTITYNFLKDEIEFLNEGKILQFKNDGNQHYLNEMRYFISNSIRINN